MRFRLASALASSVTIFSLSAVLASAADLPSGSTVSFSSDYVSNQPNAVVFNGHVVLRIPGYHAMKFSSQRATTDADGTINLEGNVTVAIDNQMLVADKVTIRHIGDSATGYVELTAGKAELVKSGAPTPRE